MNYRVGQRNMPPVSEVQAAFEGIFARGYFANNGPLVRQLDRDLATYLRVPYGASVATEMVGMMLLASAAFPPGEVIASPLVGAATVEALEFAGLDVVFGDVEPDSFALDAASVRRAVNEKTVGIVGVHTFGRVAGAEDTELVARDLALPLVFDATDALGARACGKGAGAYGLGAIVSLHERCVLNGSQGGFFATTSERLARHLRTTRNFHQSETFVEGLLRLNAKMAESSAALALVGLRHLDGWIDENARRVSVYRERFASVSATRLVPFDVEASNFARVIVDIDLRQYEISAAEFLGRTFERGIKVVRALPDMTRRDLRFSPIAKALYDRLFELPNSSTISEADAVRVADTIISTLR